MAHYWDYDQEVPILKDFVTDEELKGLLAWATLNESLGCDCMYSHIDEYMYVNQVLETENNATVVEIENRLSEEMGLKDNKRPEVFTSWLSVYYDGGDLKPHTDPLKEGGHLRLNLIIQMPHMGGVPFYAGKDLKVEAGDIYMYPSPDKELHGVTKVSGGKSRIALSMGWVV